MVVFRVSPEAHPNRNLPGGSSASPPRPADGESAGRAGAERLAVLVHTQSRQVWRALLRLGVPHDALDDATQEVFIVVARRLGQIEAGSERAFLYATAVRVAANQRRARRTRREQPLDQTDPASLVGRLSQDDLVDHKRMRDLLDRVLEAMPHELREVFVLFELEEFTRTEIARVLGLPEGTVASRLRRARDTFEQLCATPSRAGSGDNR